MNSLNLHLSFCSIHISTPFILVLSDVKRVSSVFFVVIERREVCEFHLFQCGLLFLILSVDLNRVRVFGAKRGYGVVGSPLLFRDFIALSFQCLLKHEIENIHVRVSAS